MSNRASFLQASDICLFNRGQLNLDKIVISEMKATDQEQGLNH